MPELTIPQEDSDDITVDVSEVKLPDGYSLMSKQELSDQYVTKDYHASEIQRVSQRFQNSNLEEAKEQLKEDDGFVQSILDEHGAADGEEVQALKAKLQKAESDNEALSNKLSTYQQRNTRSSIMEAAIETDIRSEYRTGLDGSDPYIVSALEGRTEELDDGTLVVTDREGNRLPGEEGTYRTVKEQLQMWKGSEDYDFLFSEPQRNNGSGYNGSNGSGGKKKRSQMSTKEKVSFIEEHGREAYTKLEQ